MINPGFYTAKSLTKLFTNGKVSHYPQRQPALVIKSQDYTVVFGDTYYSIARKLFGDNRQHLWTVIADINTPMYPDELEAGRIIKVPLVIVQDTFTT